MDVILDSNIYLRDPQLKGTQFGELFAYVRRTKSRLVLPELVCQEVLERYREKVHAQFDDARKAWAQLQKLTMSKSSNLEAIDIDREVALLEKRLRNPAVGVEVCSLPFSEMVGIDMAEVVRRGIKRIRPASAQGEELRDVVLWLVLLQHAKKSNNPVAFISDDNTFKDADGDSLHPTLQSDMADADVEVAFYQDIGKFITQNSLATQPIKEAWFSRYLTREKITEEILKQLLQLGQKYGPAETPEVEQLSFTGGKRYKVAQNSFYAEATFEGTGRVLVKMPSYESTLYVGSGNFVWGEAGPGQTGIVNTVPLNESLVSEHSGMGYTFEPATGFSSLMPASPPYRAVPREVRAAFKIEISARVELDALVDWQVDTFLVKAHGMTARGLRGLQQRGLISRTRET